MIAYLPLNAAFCLSIPQLKLDPLSSLYYIAPLCALFIGVACFMFESAELPYERMFTSQFMLTMLINGLVSFTLNVAVVLLISNTSALVLTLAGIVKDILLVFLSVAVFSSPVTLLQYFGYRYVAPLHHYIIIHSSFIRSFIYSFL